MWILLVYNVCSHFLLDCVAILFIFHAISQSFFFSYPKLQSSRYFFGSLRLHVLLSSRIFQFRQTNIFDLQKRREARSEKKTKLKVGIKCVHKSKFMFGFVIISNLFVITIKSDRNMQFFFYRFVACFADFVQVQMRRTLPWLLCVGAVCILHMKPSSSSTVNFSVKTVSFRFLCVSWFFFFVHFASERKIEST